MNRPGSSSLERIPLFFRVELKQVAQTNRCGSIHKNKKNQRKCGIFWEPTRISRQIRLIALLEARLVNLRMLTPVSSGTCWIGQAGVSASKSERSVCHSDVGLLPIFNYELLKGAGNPLRDSMLPPLKAL